MLHNFKKSSNQLTLALNSNDNSYGFGYRENNNDESDHFFIKKFDNDLCNNLVVDFDKFISKENLKRVNRIKVSLGPANFNASRLIVVLARTISQQINCPLEGVSSFQLMAKRIALKNSLFPNIKSFWIYKKLKRKGFIAGKYQVYLPHQNAGDIVTRENVIPKLFENLENSQPNFEANYEDKQDLKELLNLSNKNLKIANLNSWEKVFPIYPISPFN